MTHYTVVSTGRLVCDWQEKLTMEKRLDDSDVYIVSLQEKIKTLVTEKETLLQAKKDLEKEKEHFQVQTQRNSICCSSVDR